MGPVNYEKALSRIARDLGVCVFLAAIFSFMGVYDSDGLPSASRFLFWLVLMMSGALAVSMAEPFVMKHWIPDRPVVLQIAAASALVALPLTLGLVGLNTDMRWSYSISNWILQFLSVWIIALLIIIGRFSIRALMSSSGKTASIGDPPDPTGTFMQRLPIKFRNAELWAVSSEGHYLRVHTNKGETLILLRLSDAMRDLDGVEGEQTHRSWWVARDGVDALESVKGKTVITLKSGTDVPVSRARVAAVKSLDWH